MNAAEPRESSVAVAMLEEPSLNVTVPDGVPDAALTRIAKVTAWPKTLGFVEEFSVTVATFLFTTCDKGAEVLALEFASPE